MLRLAGDQVESLLDEVLPVFLRSPLADSNRRPPLYEEGPRVIHEGAGLVNRAARVTDCGRLGAGVGGMAVAVAEAVQSSLNQVGGL